MTDTRAAFEAWFEADQMGNTEEYYAPKDRAWAAWQEAARHEREAIAKLIDARAAECNQRSMMSELNSAAAAIRARGD